MQLQMGFTFMGVGQGEGLTVEWMLLSLYIG